jgi:hypothetical protein
MMEDTGRTSGGFEVPEGSSYALSFPHVDTTETPNPSTLTPPAESGLSGAPMATPASTPDMGKPQPVQPAPHPAETAARGVFAALSGAGGHPMDWARATIAGGLAAAANVGQVAPGQGFLAGVGKGAQAVQQRQDQQQAIARQQQQQQFENAEKQKADTRAQQELDNSTATTKAQVALHNAQTLAAIHADQNAQAMEPYMEAEAKAKFTAVQQAQAEARQNLKKVLIESGMKPEDADKSINSYSEAPSGGAEAIGSGNGMIVHNGESASAGEDSQGVHLASNGASLFDQKIPNDTKVLTGYQYDPKKGFVPQYETASAGTSVGTIIAIHDAAEDYLQKQQKQLTDQASLKKSQAETNLAETGAVKNLAEADKAKAEAANQGQNPIYAYNTQTKQTELITPQDMQAKPGVYTNPVKVKQGDIEKDKEASLQLNDAQMNLTRAKLAYDKYDHLGPVDQRAVAAILGDDKFKGQVGLFGTHAEIPVDWLNKLLNSENYQQLSPQAQAAVTGYLGLKSAAIAYQKAVTKSGRSSDKSLAIEEAMLPDPTLPRNARASMMDRFQENVNQVSKGLPLIPGVERPMDVRGNLEKEDAAKQGATHVYNPASGQAEPVKNIFGKVIGHRGPNGEVVRDQ